MLVCTLWCFFLVSFNVFALVIVSGTKIKEKNKMKCVCLLSIVVVYVCVFELNE